jgi:hypothetical protein
MSRTLILASLTSLFAACGSSEPPPKTLEEQAAEKCPRVSHDAAKMAGDWVLGTGSPKTRFRVFQDGDRTVMWYIDPAFSNHKLELVGTARDKDWKFEEVPVGRRKLMVAAGGEPLKRVYLQHRLQQCAMEIFAGTVDAEGREVLPPQPKVFRQWPDGQQVSFSFAPHNELLFVGEAATDKKKADQQLVDLGSPGVEAAMGKVTVGLWTEVAADGDPSCTYTFDAWFDDQPVEGASAVAAGAAADGWRHWTHTFDAPYTGNHGFELHRYRQCGDGARELISVAGSDVVLL